MYKDWEEKRKNIVDNTDCYNDGHFIQKVNTDWEISHIYNRKSPMVLYGFNPIVIDVMKTKIEDDMVEEARESAEKMDLPFPYDMWMSVVKDFKGKIPLRVRALPDGRWVPKGTPFASIENTEEGFGELVTWFEGRLLKCAFPSGCATRALEISEYLKNNNLPNNRVHSFAYRGYNSEEDAIWGSTAWNLFLTGTDDFHSKKYTPSAEIKSIMASAHKVMQQFDDEFEGAKRQIDAAVLMNKKIVALPIDTYDAWRFIEEYMKPLLEYAETKNVHVVLRPDSGDVLKQGMAIYYKSKAFDFENCSVIIGEGMDFNIMKEYDFILKEKNIPLDFFAFGIGGGFHKDIDRDTTGLAMKTAYSNGADRMKLVKSDPFKQSIPGDVTVFRDKSTNEMFIDYGRDDNEDRKVLYEDIYYFDARSFEPQFNRMAWDDVWMNIHSDISMGYTKQKEIKISTQVQENIKKFKEKYS